MGSKTRLSSYCTKRGDNTVNLVTSRKTNARLARPSAKNPDALSKLWKGDCRWIIMGFLQCDYFRVLTL